MTIGERVEIGNRFGRRRSQDARTNRNDGGSRCRNGGHLPAPREPPMLCGNPVGIEELGWLEPWE